MWVMLGVNFFCIKFQAQVMFMVNSFHTKFCPEDLRLRILYEDCWETCFQALPVLLQSFVNLMDFHCYLSERHYDPILLNVYCSQSLQLKGNKIQRRLLLYNLVSKGQGLLSPIIYAAALFFMKSKIICCGLNYFASFVECMKNFSCCISDIFSNSC